MNRKRLSAAYLAYLVMLACGTWSLSWGQVRAVTRRAGPALPGSTAATPKFNPARKGGIGAFGVSLKGGLAAPALPASAFGSESPLGLPLTSIPIEDPYSPDALPGTAEASGLGTLGAVQSYAAQVVPGSDGKDQSPEDANDAAGKIYDKKAPEAGAVDAGAVSFAAGGDGTGGGNDGPDVPGAADPSSPLNHFYPRVVFVQDVFGKAASEKTVEYMEKLLNGGVHVVYLTWRPQKGPGSADEVILSRIKAHRNNPVVVVAFNGGKISLHGRAANPKSIIEDVDAFKPSDLEVFQAVNDKVAKALKLTGSLKETALPSKDAAFSYTVELPEQIPQGDLAKARSAAMKAYNARLQAAGLPYRMAEHPENPRALITQSMPLRFSLPRVMNALESVFPGENLQASPEKFLILADSKRSPRFTSSFPEASQIQVAKSGQEVEDIFGAVLGNRALPSVSVKLGKLRQYVEYWEPSKRWMNTDETSGGGGGGGGGGIRGPKSDRATSQMLSMYTGGLMYQMMAWFYEQVWRGQHQMTSLSAMQARLRAMWRSPFKYGVYVSKPLAKTMSTPAWKAMNRGYLEHANSYLTNFYMREFGDYTTAARNVQDNLVGLATDRKSLITLEFASSSTGKLYRIHTRIPRVMKLDTSEGRVLTAYAYRTGKETPDNGEEVFAKTLAMSLLKGHGRMGLDGKWHHGSPEGAVIARLRVQLEYRSSHRSWEFTPEEFYKVVVTPAADGKAAGVSESVQGPIVQQITSTIERMEADPEYQAHYDEQEQKASKDDLKKKKGAKAKPAAKAPAKAAASTSKKGAKGRGK